MVILTDGIGLDVVNEKSSQRYVEGLNAKCTTSGKW